MATSQKKSFRGKSQFSKSSSSSSGSKVVAKTVSSAKSVINSVGSAAQKAVSAAASAAKKTVSSGGSSAKPVATKSIQEQYRDAQKAYSLAAPGEAKYNALTALTNLSNQLRKTATTPAKTTQQPSVATKPAVATPQPSVQPTTAEEELYTPQTTVEERARALFEKENYGDLGQFAEEIGFSKDDLPSSLEQQVQQLKDKQAREYRSAKEQVDLVNEEDRINLSQAEREKLGATAAANVSLLSGREAPQSVGNEKVVGRYARTLQRNYDLLVKKADQAYSDRLQALADLEEAQKSQRADLVTQASQALANAETEINRIDAQLLEAERLASEEQRAVSQEQRAVQAENRANLSSFTSVIDSGVKLDMRGLMSIAQNLSIPLELAAEYYEGTQAIRDDKTLSQEEKQVALDDAKINLERKKAGLDDEALRKVDTLTKLRQGGATDEMISAYKSAAGITDYDDPLIQADLRLKQLDAQLAEKQLRGEPVSIQDQIALFELRQLQSELSGQGITAFIPNPTQRSQNKGISVDVSAGAYQINTPQNYQAWCGQFVNDVWGQGIFGDSYKSKQGVVDDTGVRTKDINDPFTEIVPGMAFVMGIYDKNGKSHPYGHVGIVTGVSPDGKSVYTTETNADGKYTGKSTGQGTNVSNQIRSLQSIYGFVAPPNASLVTGGSDGEGYSPLQEKVLRNLDKTKINDQTIKALKNAGLTTNDLLSYEPKAAALNFEQKQNVESVLSGIKNLLSPKNEEALTDAVGASFQKLFVGKDELGNDKFISGTQAADFEAEFNTFRDTLVIPLLDKLKGAMSDKDIALLRNAATSLSLQTSEKAFKRELQRLQTKFSELLGDDNDEVLYQKIQNAPSQSDLDLFNNL